MAIQNYIDTNGIFIQSIDEIIKDLTDKFKSIYGQDVNLDQNTPDGQWINILAQEKKDLLDLIVQIYNNVDVDSVVGLPQQILYKLNGLKIKAFTYSYVYVDVTVNKPVILQGLDENIEAEDGTGFTVSDSAGNDWILTETVELQQGVHTLNFRAKQIGNVTAGINTITTATSIVAGIGAINNRDNNYITGQVGETSAEFRTRRHRAMAVPSQGFIESIESQLYNLNEVTQAKVYTNRTNTTDEFGIPAHAIWVIVQGGKSEDIGKVIYNNLPPGIPMKGTKKAEVIRPNGEIEEMYYDLPRELDVYIKIQITRTSNIIIDEDYIKGQLSLLKFTVGESLESSYITNEVKKIIMENGNPHDITVSIDNANFTDIITPTDLDQYFVIPKDNIDIRTI